MALFSADIGSVIRLLQFLLIGLLAIAIEAAPLGLAPDSRPSPDLLLVIAAIFAFRRPAVAAVPVVFALGLVRDLMGDNAVGLGALTLVCATEWLRSAGFRGASLAGLLRETGLVWLAALVTAAVHWIVLLVLLVPRPPITALIEQTVLTTLLYPVFAVAARWLLGLNRRTPSAGSGAGTGTQGVR